MVANWIALPFKFMLAEFGASGGNMVEVVFGGKNGRRVSLSPDGRALSDNLSRALLGRGEVSDIIKTTAEKIDLESGSYDSKGHSHAYGFGRVHAEDAVRTALGLGLA